MTQDMTLEDHVILLARTLKNHMASDNEVVAAMNQFVSMVSSELRQLHERITELEKFRGQFTFQGSDTNADQEVDSGLQSTDGKTESVAEGGSVETGAA